MQPQDYHSFSTAYGWQQQPASNNGPTNDNDDDGSRTPGAASWQQEQQQQRPWTAPSQHQHPFGPAAYHGAFTSYFSPDTPYRQASYVGPPPAPSPYTSASSFGGLRNSEPFSSAASTSTQASAAHHHQLHVSNSAPPSTRGVPDDYGGGSVVYDFSEKRNAQLQLRTFSSLQDIERQREWSPPAGSRGALPGTFESAVEVESPMSDVGLLNNDEDDDLDAVGEGELQDDEVGVDDDATSQRRVSAPDRLLSVGGPAAESFKDRATTADDALEKGVTIDAVLEELQMSRATYDALSPTRKRQIRNKVSARAFRARKKSLQEMLEAKVADRDAVIAALQEQILDLQRRNAELEERLQN